MAMPGFVANTSPRTSSPCRHARLHRDVRVAVSPATWIDTFCLNDCYQNCTAGCVGAGKAQCISECRREYQACKEACTRPGDPPEWYPGSGGGMVVYGNYCGPGFTDLTGRTPAKDAVDSVCKAHDLCYRDNGDLNCRCDQDLVNAMPTAIADTSSAEGKAAGTAATLFFAHSPCWCQQPPGPSPPWPKVICQR